jgi:hypothetical protein
MPPITIYHLYKSTEYRSEHKNISQHTFRRWVQSGKITAISITRESIYVIEKEAFPLHPSDRHPYRWPIGVAKEILKLKSTSTVKNWGEKGYFQVYEEDGNTYVDKRSFNAYINRKYQE